VRRADYLFRGEVWMSVSCECCVLLGRDHCVGPITCTEESYGRLSAVSVVCCRVEACATG